MQAHDVHGSLVMLYCILIWAGIGLLFSLGKNQTNKDRSPPRAPPPARVGGVPSVSADLFDTLGGADPLTHGLDYVAAGHLHRPQNISGTAVPIRYAGSPIAYSFSEAGATKSTTLVTTDATSVTDIEVVPIPTLRAIAVLEGTMEELLTDPDEAATASSKEEEQ